ncbi:MAG: hypothetical protein NTX65_15105 [Ignavibacteriales bacterium]|nr:hypothetical protein [Ignavibacteriales bacterium]
MLLETLDLRKNDVLIYSQNMFNFNDSFKIIYKNEKIKSPRRISYFDVCAFIKDPSPKNLIIYRLLTNVNSLDAYSTKYGYFIQINGKIELIYFDPVFAIKDLRHLRFDLDPSEFRFKIQQVGLTSLTKKETEPNFAEVYSFDLKAVEAQSQNDKIYADAIFAFDDSFIEEEADAHKVSKDADEIKMRTIEDRNPKVEAITNVDKIAEDINLGKQNLSMPKTPDAANVQVFREEIIDLLKQALGIPNADNQIIKDAINKESASAIKINNDTQNLNSVEEKEEPVNNLFDLFKSTSKSDELSERERKSVILKFD